ncbi:MAG: polymerase primary sigma factor [Solirubrobacteraceae bacterium]|jgi:RNA polymerase sigma factor (sigma-70 family)|nr:polymerase primary sigma factor [Solirubrobacteraceae bacterium]
MLASSMDHFDHGRASRARLSHAAEHDMVLAAQAGDAAARERLIEAFLPLVGSIARIYRSSSVVDRTELVQEGVVGLLRALQRYDPTLETPFWAYASWWVRQAMQQLVSELTRAVVLSDRALRQLARLKDAQAQHTRAHGREPTLLELASGCGLSRRQVQSLIAAERKPRALEEPLGGDDDTGGTLGDVLADPRAEDAYDMVPIRVEVDELPRLLDGLNDREAAIVRARYGLDGVERTLQELAGSLGLSAERVRQIEQAALDKMRAAARA